MKKIVKEVEREQVWGWERSRVRKLGVRSEVECKLIEKNRERKGEQVWELRASSEVEKQALYRNLSEK